MGRSENPMDVHRRKQRKKELQKQKTTRIQARDEQVKDKKTIKEVKDAIQKLEKRKAHLSHNEKQKLDRLYKELKLVKQALEESKANGAPRLPPTPQRPLTELDDPRKSVYWDEVMNPYGAPPPGKPRLYHRRGGGTTMDMREAIVPGEEEPEIDHVQAIPPPPPPPPPPPRRQEHVQPHRQQQPREHPAHRQQQEQSTSAVVPPPPPPPPPPLPKHEPIPTAPPSLPPPSKAVQRTLKKKRKLNADIWASTEEVLYHKHVDHVDLEGTCSTETQWWYRDNQQQQLQGPFSSEQMQAWNQAGFFPPNTPVRKGNNEDFVEMSSIDWNAQVAAATKNNSGGKKKKRKQQKGETDVNNRIAAVKAQETQSTKEMNDIDNRIAALKAQDNDNQEAMDDPSVNDRIAALRAQDDLLSEETAIEERILALRRQNEEEQEQEEEDSVEARIAALKGEQDEEIELEQEEQDESSDVQDRINALKSERIADQIEANEIIGNDPEQAAHPSDEMLSGPVYTAAIQDDTAAQEPPPAYYPLPEDMGGDEFVAPYPSDMEYPVDDAYPVNDAYPSVDDGDESAYPVLAPYPTEDDAYPVNDSTPEPQKKVYKADKEVVGLVPTNLHKRRATKPVKAKSKATSASASSCRDTPAAKPNSKSVADDYDDFMKEINDLK